MGLLGTRNGVLQSEETPALQEITRRSGACGLLLNETGRRSQHLKTPDKSGDMFQAPPRRDYVSPFGSGRDWPQRARRSQSLKTSEQNGDMFQAPPRRDYVSPFGSGRDWPQRARRSQSLKTSEQNGDMFQAPPRRGCASPLQPEDSHGGLPLHYKGDRRCAAPKGRPGMARDLAGRSAARQE